MTSTTANNRNRSEFASTNINEEELQERDTQQSNKMNTSWNACSEEGSGGGGDDSSDQGSVYKINKYDHGYNRGDSVVRDAVCASTALMGENVYDSPTQPHHETRLFQLRDRSALGTPSSRRSNRKSSELTTLPVLDHSCNSSSHTLNHDENASSLSVGIMAQGLAWARRQRERRQRQYLLVQAEQQLMKLQQAKAEQISDDSNVPGRSLAVNSVYQNLTLTKPKETKSETSDDSKMDTTLQVTQKISKSGDGYTVELPEALQPKEDDVSWIPPVRVDDESDLPTSPPLILSSDEMQQIIVEVLPKQIAYCKWKRYYSLARDGDSFEACLRSIEGERYTLLVVRTSRNAIFGGFADEAWESHRPGYHGGPASCLFRLDLVHASFNNNNNNNTSNEYMQSRWNESAAATATTKSKSSSVIRCYHWTGANRYVLLCDVSNKMLAFGGGGSDGAFGLCVEKDFQVGSTGPCATFDNDPLCDQENFDIVDMEIYGFLVGQF